MTQVAKQRCKAEDDSNDEADLSKLSKADEEGAVVMHGCGPFSSFSLCG